jgi:hypothetical protein
MNLIEIKNILKEINEPNEFTLQPLDLIHPLYWVFYIPRVRIKKINPQLENLRLPNARFDTFINGLFIRNEDFIIENEENNFIIKFIRSKFPTLDRFGNPYTIDETDVVEIKGDLEQF